MKSMPAASASRASLRLSCHVPDQRSGTLVTARPEEQFAPNSPIFSRLPWFGDIRCGTDAIALDKVIPQAWSPVLSDDNEECSAAHVHVDQPTPPRHAWRST